MTLIGSCRARIIQPIECRFLIIKNVYIFFSTFIIDSILKNVPLISLDGVVSDQKIGIAPFTSAPIGEFSWRDLMMSMDVVRLLDETLFVGAGKSRIGLCHHADILVEGLMAFVTAVARAVFSQSTANSSSGSPAFTSFRSLRIQGGLVFNGGWRTTTSLNGVISIRWLVTVHFYGKKASRLVFTLMAPYSESDSMDGHQVHENNNMLLQLDSVIFLFVEILILFFFPRLWLAERNTTPSTCLADFLSTRFHSIESHHVTLIFSI